MMYDAFLKHEVALDAYISGLGGGSRVNGTNAGTPGDFGSSVDVGEEVGGGRWRDRRQVDLMRAGEYYQVSHQTEVSARHGRPVADRQS